MWWGDNFVAQEYIFDFPGTKQEFLNKLNIFPNNYYSDGRFYYVDNYIVDVIGDEIRFGIERAGHSGGQWFIPTVTEQDGKLRLSGSVKYIGPINNSTAKDPTHKKVFYKISEILLYILVAPFVLIIYFIYKILEFFKWLKTRMFHKPSVKPLTKEEKLIDFMVNFIGCTRKETV